MKLHSIPQLLAVAWLGLFVSSCNQSPATSSSMSEARAEAPVSDAAPENPAPAEKKKVAETEEIVASAPQPSVPLSKGKTGWPMWGGSPDRNMYNPHGRNIPHDFDTDSGKHVLWKADLGSQTYGNPTVAGDKVLVGTNNQAARNPDIRGDKGVMMCFNRADGKFLWQMVHDKLSIGRVNDWPEQGICSTPVIEGDRFYYVSNRAEVVCADMEGFLDGENDGPYEEEKYKSKIDGDIVWTLNMIEELDVFPHNLATSSPVIGGDLIFILTSNGVDEGHIDIPSPDAPSFIAVRKDTGELVWENDAPEDRILHGQWASPAYGEIGGKKQVIFPGGDGWVYSLEPETGEIIWKFDCNPKRSKWILGGRGTRNSLISTPVIYNDHVYIAVGQDPEHGEGPGHLYSIAAAGKTGDITQSGQAWHFGGKAFNRTISTVAIADGLLYAVDLSGFLNCLDVQTGKPYWVYDTLAAVWGSPMVVDGKVFLGDEDGDLVILKHGKESSEPLAEPNLGSSVYSTVTVVDDVLYISSRTELIAIQKKD